MYYILYEISGNRKTWEVVSGEDAMQIRVSELMDYLKLSNADDIIVFNVEDEYV